jgi:hypothetical protein
MNNIHFYFSIPFKWYDSINLPRIDICGKIVFTNGRRVAIMTVNKKPLV